MKPYTNSHSVCSHKNFFHLRMLDCCTEPDKSSVELNHLRNGLSAKKAKVHPWMRQARVACVRGQMAVELAVLLPVVIVISLIVAQGFFFIALVQDFSTQARAAVLSCACSTPQDEGTSLEAVIQQRIQNGMGSKDCEIQVRARPHEFKGVHIFSFMAQPVTYECELRYAPWYPYLLIAGVEGSHPTPFVFTLEITVDPYKSGVVM